MNLPSRETTHLKTEALIFTDCSVLVVLYRSRSIGYEAFSKALRGQIALEGKDKALLLQWLQNVSNRPADQSSTRPRADTSVRFVFCDCRFEWLVFFVDFRIDFQFLVLKKYFKRFFCVINCVILWKIRQSLLVRYYKITSDTFWKRSPCVSPPHLAFPPFAFFTPSLCFPPILRFSTPPCVFLPPLCVFPPSSPPPTLRKLVRFSQQHYIPILNRHRGSDASKASSRPRSAMEPLHQDEPLSSAMVLTHVDPQHVLTGEVDVPRVVSFLPQMLL